MRLSLGTTAFENPVFEVRESNTDDVFYDDMPGAVPDSHLEPVVEEPSTLRRTTEDTFDGFDGMDVGPANR